MSAKKDDQILRTVVLGGVSLGGLWTCTAQGAKTDDAEEANLVSGITCATASVKCESAGEAAFTSG